MMQLRLISQHDIFLGHISVATEVVLVLHKASILRIFAKSMRIVTPHVSVVPIRHADFSEKR